MKKELRITPFKQYPKCELKVTLFCGGVDAPRTIEGNAKLQEAYEMGKNL